MQFFKAEAGSGSELSKNSYIQIHKKDANLQPLIRIPVLIVTICPKRYQYRYYTIYMPNYQILLSQPRYS